MITRAASAIWRWTSANGECACGVCTLLRRTLVIGAPIALVALLVA